MHCFTMTAFQKEANMVNNYELFNMSIRETKYNAI